MDDNEDVAAPPIEAAVEKWGDTVLRLARARLGSQADAEDVFQTVFMKLFQAERAFLDEEHLKAWLLRVTVNCCNDVHRSPWRKRIAPLDDDTARALEAAQPDAQEDEELAQALERLNAKQRTAVHLFYYEGYSTDEIARMTGERPATVRSHLHRARKALKIELGGHHG